VIGRALVLLAAVTAPAAAGENALLAATGALDQALASGLSREAFHGLHGRLVSEASGAGPPASKPAILELLAAAAAADAIWRDAFTGSLCSDPDEMAAALAELRERTRTALGALAGEP
jgi:hypothetical protein